MSNFNAENDNKQHFKDTKYNLDIVRGMKKVGVMAQNRSKLKDLNEYIMCSLCSGYLVEATTINECVHTFCRSCIVNYFKNNIGCPKPGCSWYNTESINFCSLRPDSAMRALVYKMIPGLYQSENQRLVNFQADLCDLAGNSMQENLSYLISNDMGDFYSPDEPISLSLEYDISDLSAEDSTSLPSIRYLQCPAAVTVKHLKRFISCKFDLNVNQYAIEIVYENDILPIDFSLMDVAYCYKWKRFTPMKFLYRILLQPILRKQNSESITSEITTTDIKSYRPSPSTNTNATTPQTTNVSTNNNNNNNVIKIENQENENYTNLKKKIKLENETFLSDSNNSSSNKNNNYNNNKSTKLVSSNNNCSVKIKEMKLEDEIILKGNNNQTNISSSKLNNNKIELSKSTSPNKPTSDFKILRSNDSRYTHLNVENKTQNTEATIKSIKNDLTLKRSHSTSKQNKNSKKSSDKKYVDEFDDDEDDDDDDEDDDIFVPPKRLSINRRTDLKPRYSMDIEDKNTKPSFSSYDFESDDPPPKLKVDINSKKYSKKNYTYTSISSSKESKKTEQKQNINVPKCEIDLPNLKAKITVPKTEKSIYSKKSSSDETTCTLSKNDFRLKNPAPPPLVYQEELTQRNQVEYAENIGLQPNLKDDEKLSRSDETLGSSHRKRKKAKHSKDEKGSSKRRKMHAEISSQDESLKVKVKLLPNKSHKSDRKSTSDESFASSPSTSVSSPQTPIVTCSPESIDVAPVLPLIKVDEVLPQQAVEKLEPVEDSKKELQIKPEIKPIQVSLQSQTLNTYLQATTQSQIKSHITTTQNQVRPVIKSQQQIQPQILQQKPQFILPKPQPTIQPQPAVQSQKYLPKFNTEPSNTSSQVLSLPQLKVETDNDKKGIEDVEEMIKGNKIIKNQKCPDDNLIGDIISPPFETISEKPIMVKIPNLNQDYLESNKDALFVAGTFVRRNQPVPKMNQNPIKRQNIPTPQMRVNPNCVRNPFPSTALRHQQTIQMPKPMIPAPPRARMSLIDKQKNRPMNMNFSSPRPNFIKQYQQPRTPFPINIKSQQQQQQHLQQQYHQQQQQQQQPQPKIYDVDNYECINSPNPSTVFEFPSEIIDVTQNEKLTNRQLVSHTTATNSNSKVNEEQKTPSQVQKLSADKNLSKEPFYKSLIGSSYIQENQNKKPMPILLPPSSISVTKMSDNIKTSQTPVVDPRPSLEIVRISSNIPAIDQQVKPSISNKVSTKTNRPPPPLIKRPQPGALAQLPLRRPSQGDALKKQQVQSTTDTKITSNESTSQIATKPKTPERKNSSEINPVCDNIGALDLSGKSSRSPSTENSPRSDIKSRSNSIEEIILTSDSINKANDSTNKNCHTPEKSENEKIENNSTSPNKLSKQKKITDMFPSSSWTVNKMDRNLNSIPLNILSSTASTSSTNQPNDNKLKTVHEIKSNNNNNNNLKLISSKLALTKSNFSSSQSNNNSNGNTKPPPPKLNEITKVRQQTNPPVRQQNLSMRNIPNPSALAFRNQQQSNPIKNNNNTLSSSSNVSTTATTTISTSINNTNKNNSSSSSTKSPSSIEQNEGGKSNFFSTINISSNQLKSVNPLNSQLQSNNNNNNNSTNNLNPIKKFNITSNELISSGNTNISTTVSPASTNSMRKSEFKGIEKVVASLKAHAADSKSNLTIV